MDQKGGLLKRQRRYPPLRRQRARAYCFTVNSTAGSPPFDSWAYAPLLQALLEEALKATKISYSIFSKETGEAKGTDHLQGYVRFPNAVSLQGVKSLINVNHVHVEPSKGNPEQNINYCKKLHQPGVSPHPASAIFTCGIPPVGQGARTDLKALLSPIIDGTIGATEFGRLHPDVFVRYHRGIRSLANTALQLTTPRQREVNVEVHWGVTRAGKSFYAYNYEEDFSHTYVLFSKGKAGVWFDNYDPLQHRTLLIEEFAPNDIPMSLMLRICQGWRSFFPVKGTSVIGGWKNVIITSNHDPTTWYQLASNYDALAGRFNLVKEYTEQYVPLFIGPLQKAPAACGST